MTAASSASYLLFDRSQEVVGRGGGCGAGVVGVHGEAMTARPLSDRHGPFPLCIPLLHLLHLLVIVQNRLAAEAPPLTLQKDYKPVRMWTRRRHSEHELTVIPLRPLSVSKCEFTETILCFTYYNNPAGIDLNLCAILFFKPL